MPIESFQDLLCETKANQGAGQCVESTTFCLKYTYMHVCMYVCICIYMCMYVCMCVHVYMYLYVYMCACVRVCVCSYMQRIPVISDVTSLKCQLWRIHFATVTH